MPEIIERTWRVQIFTDHGTDYRIEFLRETVRDLGDGDVHHKPLPSIVRFASQVKDQAIPNGPRSIATLGDLIALVGEMGHFLALEEKARAAAAKAAADAAAAESEEVVVEEDEE